MLKKILRILQMILLLSLSACAELISSDQPSSPTSTAAASPTSPAVSTPLPLAASPTPNKTDFPIDNGPAISWPKPAIALENISFISMQEGWGKIRSHLYHTLDGGRIWTQVTSPPVPFGSLDFVDPSHGWALGSDGLYATTDGGRRWQKVVDAPSTWSPVMDYVTASDGWLAKRDELFHTGDGGITWQKVTLPSQPVKPQAGSSSLPTATIEGVYTPWAAGLSFISPQTGWVLYQRCSGSICGSWLFRTRAGGASWEKVAQGVPGQTGQLPIQRPGRGVFFLDDLHGWFVGTLGGYQVTVNSGWTWKNGPGSLPGPEATLDHLKMFTNRSGVALVRSYIVITNDGGGTWQRVTPAELRP